MKKTISVVLVVLALVLFLLAGIYSPKTTPKPEPSKSVIPSASAEPETHYPILSQTGVPIEAKLTNVNSDVIVREPGAVIENQRITGDLDIRAPGAIVKNTEILGRVLNDNTESLPSFSLENVTVGPLSCSSWGNGGIGIANYSAKNVLVRGFTDGFRVAGGEVTIQDSYVKLCGNDPEAHSDGIQAYGAANGNILIRHNVIDQRAVIAEAQTAPIFIPVGPGNGNDGLEVSIIDNILAGGGYSLRVFGEGDFSAPEISGNKIVEDSWSFGPLDVTCSRVGVWKDNAVVTYDWDSGKILSQVRELSC